MEMNQVESSLQSYLPLVNKIVNPIFAKRSNFVGKDELVNAGLMGLHEALQRYNPESDASFTTFAYKRIKGAILDYLRDVDPFSRKDRREGKTVTITQIETEDRELPIVSNAPDPFQCLIQKETAKVMRKALSKLPDIEREIITLIYFEGYSARELTDRLGVTESRISQIRSRALERLKKLVR